VSAGTVHFSKVDGVASVVFDRPEAHNAMTMAMYDQLATACAAIAADSNLRVASKTAPAMDRPIGSTSNPGKAGSSSTSR
jgi:enoyl-CoA hydratase/carnithine racemase